MHTPGTAPGRICWLELPVSGGALSTIVGYKAMNITRNTELLHLGYSPDVQRESLGTAVAVDLAVRKRCAGLILESPLMSVGKVAGSVVPFLGPLLVRGFDVYRKISSVHVPLLVVHGDADEVVPFSQG